jgi:hypothetical protein
MPRPRLRLLKGGVCSPPAPHDGRRPTRGQAAQALWRFQRLEPAAGRRLLDLLARQHDLSPAEAAELAQLAAQVVHDL